jgi:hypothetical protein
MLAIVRDKTAASMKPNKKIKALFICISKVLRFEEGSLKTTCKQEEKKGYEQKGKGKKKKKKKWRWHTYMEFFINLVWSPTYTATPTHQSEFRTTQPRNNICFMVSGNFWPPAMDRDPLKDEIKSLGRSASTVALKCAMAERFVRFVVS